MPTLLVHGSVHNEYCLSPKESGVGSVYVNLPGVSKFNKTRCILSVQRVSSISLSAFLSSTKRCVYQGVSGWRAAAALSTDLWVSSFT
jgi:hypothetical protein